MNKLLFVALVVLAVTASQARPADVQDQIQDQEKQIQERVDQLAGQARDKFQEGVEKGKQIACYVEDAAKQIAEIGSVAAREAGELVKKISQDIQDSIKSVSDSLKQPQNDLFLILAANELTKEGDADGSKNLSDMVSEGLEQAHKIVKDDSKSVVDKFEEIAEALNKKVHQVISYEGERIAKIRSEAREVAEKLKAGEKEGAKQVLQRVVQRYADEREEVVRQIVGEIKRVFGLKSQQNQHVILAADYDNKRAQLINRITNDLSVVLERLSQSDVDMKKLSKDFDEEAAKIEAEIKDSGIELTESEEEKLNVIRAIGEKIRDGDRQEALKLFKTLEDLVAQDGVFILAADSDLRSRVISRIRLDLGLFRKRLLNPNSDMKRLADDFDQAVESVGEMLKDVDIELKDGDQEKLDVIIAIGEKIHEGDRQETLNLFKTLKDLVVRDGVFILLENQSGFDQLTSKVREVLDKAGKAVKSSAQQVKDNLEVAMKQLRDTVQRLVKKFQNKKNFSGQNVILVSEDKRAQLIERISADVDEMRVRLLIPGSDLKQLAEDFDAEAAKIKEEIKKSGLKLSEADQDKLNMIKAIGKKIHDQDRIAALDLLKDLQTKVRAEGIIISFAAHDARAELIQEIKSDLEKLKDALLDKGTDLAKLAARFDEESARISARIQNSGVKLSEADEEKLNLIRLIGSKVHEGNRQGALEIFKNLQDQARDEGLINNFAVIEEDQDEDVQVESDFDRLTDKIEETVEKLQKRFHDALDKLAKKFGRQNVQQDHQEDNQQNEVSQ